ncbi:MAG TPA: glutathionylspermidine synthase family protein [Candidatus Acidoferrum sp.]|nr:glutathionylspermidine synthase family protein [Candidatus Acidoferrum sp.]
MQRRRIAERPDWRDYAESVGFDYHTIDGEPYWIDDAYYQFSWTQIEDQLESATSELHAMAMELVPEVLRSDELLAKLQIPTAYWDYLANSWQRQQPSLYGRMDLSYDGRLPPKLLELNYDTPTSLFEAGFFQWMWLEQQFEAGLLPEATDQFNSIQEKLIWAFGGMKLPRPLHFSCVDQSSEDRGNVNYLMDCAAQAGLATRFVATESIGEAGGQFVDDDGAPIKALFKLYPWEFMLQEDFAPVLLTSPTQFIEPPWKLLLSNKGILPLLWQRHPGHPNLLECQFDDGSAPLPPGWARKPIYSREGANVELRDLAGNRSAEDGPYNDGGFVRQRLNPLPVFTDAGSGKQVHALVGSWVIGGEAAGIGLREDDSPITRNTSRFVPHVILD